MQEFTLDRISDSVSTKAGTDAREFCLRIIKEFYGIDYNTAWHSDLDSLENEGDRNWFAGMNRGSFYVARDLSGKVVAAGGLYSLDRKSSTAERLGRRYPIVRDVCQIVRVYIAAERRGTGLGTVIVSRLETDAREFGYRQSYLHADASADATLRFWHHRGYREFGRFSYSSAKGTDTSVDFDKELLARS